MEIKSCDNCGVLLDVKKLNFPNIYDKEGNIDNKKAEWDGAGFVPFVYCPVCKSKILQN